MGAKTEVIAGARKQSGQEHVEQHWSFQHSFGDVEYYSISPERSQVLRRPGMT